MLTPENITRRIAVIVLMLLSVVAMEAKRVTPYSSSRIFWDIASRKTLFNNALYARMIELHDGRLMAVTGAGGYIVVSISNDKGTTWTPQQRLFTPPANYHYYDADLYQLKDGTIIICYNIGPIEPYDNVRRYGVRINRSTDNGKTWSADTQIYTAGTDFHTGCWEPAILELPSGELHLYVSDESPFPDNYDQCIQLLRSTDKGKTWSATPETISYRPGTRDGMPTPVLIGDTIIVTIEDNGWPGAASFVPVTLRSTVEENWKGITVGPTSPRRSQVIDYSWCPQAFGGAPYMRVLPWGETVLSRQAYHESNNYDVMNMYVYVGDENARGFKAMSQPFVDNNLNGISIEWNSISVIDTGIVCALGGVGAKGGTPHVEIVKGYPTKMFRAYRGTPSVDAKIEATEYHFRNATQIKMGNNSIGRQVYSDFCYDDDNLYFAIRVNDNTPFNTSSQLDAVRLLLDADNVSDDTPVEGMYNVFFKTSGSYNFWKGNEGKWVAHTDTTGVCYRLNVKSTYYIIEASIPWQVLGKEKAPIGQRMAMAIEVTDRTTSTYKTETMPDAKKEQSWTWMEFRLDDTGASGIDAAEQQDHNIYVVDGRIVIGNHTTAKSIIIYTIDGKMVYSVSNIVGQTNILNLRHGLYIVKCRLSDGCEISKKITI